MRLDMIKTTVIVFICSFYVYCNTFALNLSFSNGQRLDTSEEIRISKAPTSSIQIVFEPKLVRNCKKIKRLKAKVLGEFWESKDDICMKMYSRLKKMAFVAGANTVYIRHDHRGCPDGTIAVAYNCKLNN